jgi:hypothetical protein
MRRRRIDPDVLDRAIGQPPGAQEELEELLRVSQALTDAFQVEPRPQAVTEHRLAALAAFRVPAPLPGRAARELASPWEWLPQMRVRALATAAIVIGIFGSLLAGSYGSLPGDTLYGVKLGAEEVRLAAAVDSFDKAVVHLDIAGARIDEVVKAQETGRADAMRESLRRYSDAIIAVETELRSGDLTDSQAREVLIAAANTLEEQQVVLESLAPETPAPAQPELEDALDTLEDLEIPPPPPPGEEPSPGPSTTPTETPSSTPSESPTEEPSPPATSESPAPEPSESVAPPEEPKESDASGDGGAPAPNPEQGSEAGSQPDAAASA